MKNIFALLSHTLAGTNDQTSQDVIVLRQSIEGTLQPMIARLNETTASGSRSRRFYLMTTPGRNVWDQKPHLEVSIGHFTHAEHEAALFFNKNPRKTNTPEGTGFTEINEREYKFSVSRIAQTSTAGNPQSLYHFTYWQKISNPKIIHNQKMCVRQGKAMHIAAKKQADFTQDIEPVLKSAATYFEFKLGRPIALLEATESSAKRPPAATARHGTATAQI